MPFFSSKKRPVQVVQANATSSQNAVLKQSVSRKGEAVLDRSYHEIDQKEMNKKQLEISRRPPAGHGRQISDTIQHELVRSLPMPLFTSPYRSLDPDAARKEVRLLRLHPGKSTEPLRCSIYYEYLSSKKHLPYETISYCWGKYPGKAVVEINRIAAVTTKSAARVLHRMRHPDKDRVLWIDAICINQDDTAEKGHQVAIMGQIYGSTWRNLIYLGDDRGSASAVERTMGAVLANIRAQTDNYRSFQTTLYSLNGSPATDLNLIDRKVDLRPLRHLFSSPWFQRIWICQEAALPPQSVCHFGRVTFTLPEVLYVAQWLHLHTLFVPREVADVPGLMAASRLYIIIERSFRTQHLFALWQALGTFHATDSKDQIFGLLGMHKPDSMWPSVQALRLRPDYQRSNMEVFRNATRAMIEESRALAILHYVDILQTSPGFPSWVVDFSRTPLSSHDNQCHDVCHRASGGQTWSSARHEDPNVLAINGYLIDTVSRCTLPLTVNDSVRGHELAAKLEDVVRLAGNGSLSVGSDRKRVRDIAFTLIAGSKLNHQLADSSDEKDFIAFHLSLLPEIPAGHLPPPECPGRQVQAARVEHYYRAMEHAADGRVIFMTKGGFMGNGPRTMQRGDVIAVFPNAHLPYLLRPLPNGEHRFVGECYVHGIMYGEVIRERDRFKEALCPFYIR